MSFSARTVPDFDRLSRPVPALGKILSLSSCPFVPGQWRNFCPFVPKSCTVPSRWKPYYIQSEIPFNNRETNWPQSSIIASKQIHIDFFCLSDCCSQLIQSSHNVFVLNLEAKKYFFANQIFLSFFFYWVLDHSRKLIWDNLSNILWSVKLTIYL